jgi:serine/threonine protein kinase
MQTPTATCLFLRLTAPLVSNSDFNNGEIFDYSKAGDRYCKIFRCFGGTFRSPEEFRCILATEAMDTYSMGNNIYSLLTGLWPFYNFPEDDDKQVQNLLIDQKIRPLVDPRYRTRSFIESKLVAVMDECWEWEPERRTSIFEVVRKLREVKLATSS